MPWPRWRSSTAATSPSAACGRRGPRSRPPRWPAPRWRRSRCGASDGRCVPATAADAARTEPLRRGSRPGENAPMVGQRRPTGGVTLATETTMSYAVHHVDGAGTTHLEDHATLDDALARVEMLRNDGEASEVRVLKEVPIEVRTYYRVVAVEDASDAPPAAPAEEEPAEP